MIIRREINGIVFKFKLSEDEKMRASKCIEAEQKKSLSEMVRELPEGSSLEVRFNGKRN